MLNPFIYTLRNQQVKQAFKDLVRRKLASKWWSDITYKWNKQIHLLYDSLPLGWQCS
jgi:hypothetical protein